MFWKKEQMIKTSVGMISKSTLKQNKELVLKMYDTKIEEIESDEIKILCSMTKFFNDIVLKSFGYHDGIDYSRNPYPSFDDHFYEETNKEAVKKANKFTKKFPMDKVLGEHMKSVSELNRLREEKKLIRKNRFGGINNEEKRI